ncbi:DUF4388 domain-containing protein [Myxosarcina sp. GI1]|uniref:DUF4388 domain-containing protein n=1 Tax=Myxosarcina sp. GI1 TaxID=1541065 RepID=UPI00090796F1|nr:DUF4388 domain-containing protein [Myxosarcina sp. GI1]
MSISNTLESFSLPELFRLIEQSSKSGRLIVQIPQGLKKLGQNSSVYYIWFDRGYLIAVSNCLNYRGTIDLIGDRGWLSPPIIKRLRILCPPQVPLGVYLVKMKLLSREQLSLVFQLQLHQVYQLFSLSCGSFKFDEFGELQDRILTLPWLEMTGYKIRTIEVSLYALRLIENWEMFTDQLPEASFALKRLVAQPHLKLIAVERQVWELADGVTSIANMARKTLLPEKEIQIAAFRIMVVGLVEEVFLSNYGWQMLNENYSSFANKNITSTPAANRDSKKLTSNLIEFITDKFTKKSHTT